MLRRTLKIKLSQEERQKLKDILDSSDNLFLQSKAQVLLLTDEGEHGPGRTCKEVADELNIGKRTVGRCRQAYVDGNGISSLFEPDPRSNAGKLPSTTAKTGKNRKRYVEEEYEQPGYTSSARAKYRVLLTEQERDQLQSVLSKGKHTLRKITRVKILLTVDEGKFGPAMSDEDVVTKLGTSSATVQRVRKIFVIEGSVDAAINFKHQRAGRPPKIDGRVEAHLTKLACSEPPDGLVRWTLRLLADKLVELEIIEEISHVSIGNALKKMNLSLG